MCGRYASSAEVDDLVEQFDIAEVRPGVPGPSWNVAPTDTVRAVVDRAGHPRSLVPMRWGLVPFWADSPSIGARMINARRETVADKPAFRRSLRARRCLLPSDGYYEWQRVDGGKQPWLIHRVDGRQLAMAGLWDVWHDRSRPDDPPLITCTIITTGATDRLGHVHDRMPVALADDVWATWLDPELDDADLLTGLLAAPDPEDITGHRVGSAVGRVSNNGPDLVRPVGDRPE